MTGTPGSVPLKGWTWLDALSMTVVTLATIGCGETHPLSDAGRVFTFALCLVGAGTLAYTLVGTTQLFAPGGLDAWRWRARTTRTLRDIAGHTLASGCRRLGGAVAGALRRQGAQVLVIDRPPPHARARFLSDAPSAAFVGGNASEYEVPKRAGVERARPRRCTE